MLFNEFANDILYKHSGSAYKPHEYLLFLFDQIMEDPKTDVDIAAAHVGKYNPFEASPDTNDRKLKGTIPLGKRNVQKVLNHPDTNKFASYIDNLPWENQRAIEEELKKRIQPFNEDDVLGYACADLFMQILNDIYDGAEFSSPIMDHSTPTAQMQGIPIVSVYYDASDGKLHIGDIEINIPAEIAPPDDIAPHEEIYVKALFDAYASAMKSGPIDKDALSSLPNKYKRNFSDQRINYYSAVRIDRFVRETIADGNSEADKWKKGTFDYIKDTLWDDYDDGYKRLLEVLKKVVDSSTTSVIEGFKNLIGAKEKKGVCHLLANDGTLQWVDNDE